jgi:hypothetical protein
MAKPRVARPHKSFKPKRLPLVDYLHQILVYDHAVEGLRWRVDRMGGRWGRTVAARAGDRAGTTLRNGGRLIGIDGRRYYEHRLVHKMLAFEEPPPVLDHVGIKDRNNNQYSNIRPLTWSASNFHRSKFSNNMSGIVGVSWHRATQKWSAVISVRGRLIHLGLFDEIKDAAAARRAAELKYFPGVA